jgi:hypothetical protein
MQSLLVCFDRRFDRMARMSEVTGGDLVDAVLRRRIEDGEFRTALFACAGCRRETACSRWLDARGGQVAGAPPFFCPNADVFERLATRA